MSRSVVFCFSFAMPLALGISTASLAENVTARAVDAPDAAEWAQVRVDAAENDAVELQPMTYYRWLCQAKSRSRSLVFSHSANNIGQAQFRSLGECRSRMDSYGYYPGYCQLLRCQDRWNAN